MVLAPINLEPLAVVGSLPHAFGFERNHMSRATFTAQCYAQFVGAAQHAVVTGLRLAGIGNVVAMATKEVATPKEQLSNAASAMATVYNAGAEEIGAQASVVTLCVRDVDVLCYRFPIAAMLAHHVC